MNRKVHLLQAYVWTSCPGGNSLSNFKKWTEKWTETWTEKIHAIESPPGHLYVLPSSTRVELREWLTNPISWSQVRVRSSPARSLRSRPSAILAHFVNSSSAILTGSARWLFRLLLSSPKRPTRSETRKAICEPRQSPRSGLATTWSITTSHMALSHDLSCWLLAPPDALPPVMSPQSRDLPETERHLYFDLCGFAIGVLSKRPYWIGPRTKRVWVGGSGSGRCFDFSPPAKFKKCQKLQITWKSDRLQVWYYAHHFFN